MSASGDMTFGQGSANFLIDTPDGVAQAAGTRLRLWTGDWFLDLTEGTPWGTQVLGKNTQAVYDQAIIDRLLGTPGALGLANYQSQLDRATRALTWSSTLNTLYGSTALITDTVTPLG